LLLHCTPLATHAAVDTSGSTGSSRQVLYPVVLVVAELHYCDRGPLTAQYLLVVDTLNFCFW
jgi:hypothetical protein